MRIRDAVAAVLTGLVVTGLVAALILSSSSTRDAVSGSTAQANRIERLNEQLAALRGQYAALQRLTGEQEQAIRDLATQVRALGGAPVTTATTGRTATKRPAPARTTGAPAPSRTAPATGATNPTPAATPTCLPILTVLC